jgi:phytoene/squalene synthetase
MSSQREEFLKIFDSIEFDKIIDHPNILIAARFWPHERYCAAKIFYKFMRKIDDMIDDYKASHKSIAESERDSFISKVNEWLNVIIKSEECNPLQQEMINTIEKFRLPLWPMEDFARSMLYDINNDGFPTLDSFLEYSGGASVAPASVFVHLNGLSLQNGSYELPPFDVREAATPCAIFSYLVHIIRDFQKDQLNNLNYFADDMLRKHRLNRFDLKEIAFGHPVSDNFRRMIKDYYLLADQYRILTYEMLEKILPLHAPRYQLSLKIIFNLYLMVFERIDIEKGNYKSAELNPTPEETRQRVYDTIVNFQPK